VGSSGVAAPAAKRVAAPAHLEMCEVHLPGDRLRLLVEGGAAGGGPAETWRGMRHAAILTFVLLAGSLAGEAQAAPGAAPGSVPAAPVDEALDLMQEPVALEDVTASLDVSDGVVLEVRYTLREVGDITIAVRGADDGAGLGFVRVGDSVVAEVQFVEGAPVAETVDVSSLRPAQAHALAASLVQVWREEAVTEAFAVVALDDRDFKCTLAGQIAGAVSGVGAFAACDLLYPNPLTCGKVGGGAWAHVSFYITNKCNKAQNH
jgi:hypothetical protein